MATFECTCRDCGVKYQAGNSASFRCPKCRLEATRAKRRLPEQGIRKCEQCGADFRAIKTNHKFCSRECTVKADRAKNKRTSSDLFRYQEPADNYSIDSMPDLSRVLIVSDHQFPFVDQPFLDAEERFIEDWKPNLIVYAGDIIDCYEVSSFDKRPERLFNLATEFEMCEDMLRRQKRLSGGARQVFIAGNHEDRLRKIIWDKAQGFSFMVSDIPSAMHLDQYCEAYIEYGHHLDLLGFVVTHGTMVRSHSAYTAKAMIDRYRSSGASGHTHRAGSHSLTDHRKVSHTWFELGCHCVREMDYTKGDPNWQSAMLIGTVYNNALHPSLVRVVEANGQRGFEAAGRYYRINDEKPV